MLLSRIKRILSIPRSNKKQGNGYLKSDLHSPLPGQKARKNSRYAKLKSRLSRLRQALAAGKRTGRTGYRAPAARKKILVKLTAASGVALALMLFLLLGGGRQIMKSFASLPFFQVSGIVFSGNDSISEEKLREASKIVLHQTSLIGLNCSQLEADLVAVPWVAKAEVNRNWPSTVEISVVENIPVALLYSNKDGKSQMQYIDKKGVPFLRVWPGADVDYPVITGLTEIGEPAIRQQALAEVLIFLKALRGNNPNLPAQSVSEIHLNQDGAMVVYLVENPFPIFFGKSNTSRKYGRLVQVLKSLYKKQNVSRVEYIQMDYLNDKVLVAQSESG